MRRSSFLLLALLSASSQAQSRAPSTQEGIVAQALRLSPSVAAARQHVVEAQARVSELTGERKFQLSFSGSLGGSTGEVAEPPSSQGFLSAEASLTAPFPNVGRADAEIDQARSLAAAAAAQLRRTELGVEFQASQAFIDVWRTRQARTIATENLAQAERQASDTKKRIDAGTVPSADMLKVQVPVSQNRAALARAKIAESIAVQNLNDLLQRDLTSPLDLTEPAQGTGAVETGPAVTAALALSPDVVEAKAYLNAARAGLKVVKHDRDVDTSLQLSHARTSDPTAYSYVTTLALTFSLPLVDGGAARQRIRQAESQVNQTESALKIATRQARLAIEQAVLDVQGDEANLAATAETEQIAKESLDKARQSYEAGLTTTRDVLDAQLIYSQARVDHNLARYDLAVANARLKQVMGEP